MPIGTLPVLQYRFTGVSAVSPASGMDRVMKLKNLKLNYNKLMVVTNPILQDCNVLMVSKNLTLQSMILFGILGSCLFGYIWRNSTKNWGKNHKKNTNLKK